MNAVEKLAREISRVTQLRCLYQSMEGRGGLSVGPVVALITARLENAFKVIGNGDGVEHLAALQELELFD